MFQRETVFAGASDEPVREFSGKSRFSYQPVHGQGGQTVSINRLATKQVSGVTHYVGACDAEYQHGAFAAELFKLLFEVVSEAADSPSAGLTTHVFRLRRLSRMATAKLGLEYEPVGPFYILHGVVADALRLTATARSRAKLRVEYKARELEQVDSVRTYTHEPLTFYDQFNFETETVGGPCFDDGVSGLSCKLVSGDTLLATEDGFVLTTEDGFELLLDSEQQQFESQPGSAFTVFVNGEQMLATELSFEGRETKTPARFDRNRKPAVMKPGAPAASGELALYMNGDEVPAVVRSDAIASVSMVADFGGGRGMTITMPRVKFGAGTPELVSRGELVYRAPFSVLEPSDVAEQQSSVTLVV